jgi:hypothetical protein
MPPFFWSTMRILFIKTFATDRVVFRRGKEYDVSEPEAGEYIEKQLAEEVKLAAMPPTPAKNGKSNAKTRLD